MSSHAYKLVTLLALLFTLQNPHSATHSNQQVQMSLHVYKARSLIDTWKALHFSDGRQTTIIVCTTVICLGRKSKPWLTNLRSKLMH